MSRLAQHGDRSLAGSAVLDRDRDKGRDPLQSMRASLAIKSISNLEESLTSDSLLVYLGPRTPRETADSSHGRGELSESMKAVAFNKELTPPPNPLQSSSTQLPNQHSQPESGRHHSDSEPNPDFRLYRGDSPKGPMMRSSGSRDLLGASSISTASSTAIASNRESNRENHRENHTKTIVASPVPLELSNSPANGTNERTQTHMSSNAGLGSIGGPNAGSIGGANVGSIGGANVSVANSIQQGGKQEQEQPSSYEEDQYEDSFEDSGAQQDMDSSHHGSHHGSAFDSSHNSQRSYFENQEIDPVGSANLAGSPHSSFHSSHYSIDGSGDGNYQLSHSHSPDRTTGHGSRDSLGSVSDVAGGMQRGSSGSVAHSVDSMVNGEVERGYDDDFH